MPTTQKPFYKKNELREILTSSGIHCYNEQDNVIYCGNGFLGMHTISDGEVKITLPQKYKIKSLFGTDEKEIESDTITLNMPKHDTVIFELE